MKLNVISPLPPAKTSIAGDLWHSLPALRELAEIVLWTNQETWDERLEQWAEVRRFPGPPDFWHQLHRADITVYQIGNNAQFHGEIADLSRNHPGVVVLHDLALQHLFGGVFLEYRRAPEVYLEVMGRHYGNGGRRAARRLIECRCATEDLAIRFPLTEHALEGALGILVHTRDAYAAVQGFGCPVACAGLPFAPRRRPTAERRGAGDLHRLIIFGFLGPNRRIAAVLEALAGLSAKERYRLDVYGNVWDVEGLRRFAEALGVGDLVRFHGFVSEDELLRALDAADLAINLRNPTMGESSGSQLRIWNHALPSLVSKTGWYSELPADTVAFVRNEQELEDIRRHLETLFEDPAELRRMGARGRRYLETHHSPARYARAIVDVAEAARRFRASAAAREVAAKIGTLTDWSSPAAASLAARRAARAIVSILGPLEQPAAEA